MKYFIYTLNELLHDNPKDVFRMLTSLSDKFDSGAFSSLIYEIFEFQSGLINGFKQLREGNSIGKVVIRLKIEPNIGIALITRGLGGLGLVTAEVLFDIGANHIVLVSRSGKAKNYDGQNLEERLSNLLQHSIDTHDPLPSCRRFDSLSSRC